MIKRGERVYEAHLTPQGKGVSKSDRQILFRMKIEDFHKFFAELNTVLLQLIYDYYSYKLNLGRMHRYNWVVLPIADDTNKEESIIKVKKSGRHFRFKKKIDTVTLGLDFLCPSCFSESSMNKGFVYSVRNGKLRQQGFIFSISNTRGYHYVSSKAFNELRKLVLEYTFEILSKYEFEPKEQILEHIRELYRGKYLINARKLCKPKQ